MKSNRNTCVAGKRDLITYVAGQSDSNTYVAGQSDRITYVAGQSDSLEGPSVYGGNEGCRLSSLVHYSSDRAHRRGAGLQCHGISLEIISEQEPER